MGNVVVEVEFPEEVLEMIGGQRAASEAASQSIVLELVRRGEMSSRRGAELLAMDWLDFVALMDKHGIPYFNYTAEEWQRELESVRELEEALDRGRP